MQKRIARASRFRCPKLAAERRARRRARQRKRSILAHAPFLDRFKSKLEALAGRVTSRLNSLYSFESGYCVFEGYLFDFLAAFYVEINIGVVIANIYFVDQVVNEAASEF